MSMKKLVVYSWAASLIIHSLHKLKEPEGVSKGSEEGGKGDKKHYYFFLACDLKLPETERGGANTDRSVANRLL